MKSVEQVCILGMGFVGLTLAVVMAETGCKVVGVEVNNDTVEKLNSGHAHFYEIGLEARLRRVLENSSLRIVSEISEGRDADAFIITVGTPLDANGDPRMDMVKRAASEVASVMKPESLVVLRSTVRIGTTRNVVLPILSATNRNFGLAYCPERTIEGNALAELRALPQICGGLTDDDAWRAAGLFQSLTPTTIRVSQLETAELVKLLDNSFRDLSFAFGNEVALIAEAAGVDANEVIRAGNLGYERTNIAKPGLVGGPCLEKDPHILIHGLRDSNYVPQLIAAGRSLNEELPSRVIAQLGELLPEFPAGGKVAICGMAFKGRPETDDLRGSPSKLVLEAVRKKFPDAEIVVQDFACTETQLHDYSGCRSATLEDAFDNASLVIIGNNNKRYEGIPIDKLLTKMKPNGILYDFWNVVPVHEITIDTKVRCLRLGSPLRSLAV